MANKLWFGIPGSHMQWVPCPLIDSTVQRNRYLERLQFENGGGDVRRSQQYQLQYNFNMNGPAHELEGIDAFNRFASGFYGDGLIHLAYPTNFETNMLPAAWASPGLIEQGWKNICADTPTFADTASNAYNQPARTPTWRITTDAGVFTKKATIVIPPTHTLHLGASGSVSGNGGVFVRPRNTSGVIGSPTKLTMLDPAASTRTNATYSGATYQAVDVYLSRSSDAPVVRTNLVTNPSFETNTTGWTGATRDTSTFYSGVASAKLTNLPLYGALAPSSATYYPPTSAGTVYTLSAWVKGEVGKTLRAEIDARDSSNTRIGSATTSSALTMTGDWQRISVSMTMPAGTVKSRPSLWNSFAGTHTFYVDAVQLEASSTAGTYFDGSTTSTTDVINAWTGTANASTSTQTLIDISTVTLTSMMAQLYKTGTTPQIPSHHIMGEGATGLEFIDDAIVETYSYMYPPRKGIATSLVEVEAWR